MHPDVLPRFGVAFSGLELPLFGLGKLPLQFLEKSYLAKPEIFFALGRTRK